MKFTGNTTAPMPTATLCLLGAALLLPLLVYWHSAASIAEIWGRSDTYAHGYLIVPTSLWLMWRARMAWIRLPLQPAWMALGPLLVCGAVWLLADLAAVQVARQLALVAMLPLAAWLLLGTAIVRELAFPFGFLLLAVPVGDSLTEPLMQLTASWTVAGLRLSGIPVLHEGNNFTLPTGSWSVIEACSGLRYLMASVTLGCLYAYLSYRSLLRRILFVVAAVLVPLLANWLRAYLIVLLGHLTDMRQAGGVDHVLYGWVFFGIVMAVMLAVGERWRQTPLPVAPIPTISVIAPTSVIPPTAPARATSPGPTTSPAVARGAAMGPASAPQSAVLALLPAGVALVIALTVWPAWAAQLQGGAATGAPAGLQALHTSATPGAPFTAWQPAYAAPAARLQRWYRQRGAPVGLSVLYYRHQHGAGKMISSGNRLVSMTDTAWRLDSVRGYRVDLPGGRALTVVESTVAGTGGPLLVWHWYALDGHATASDTLGKVLQAWRALRTGGSDDGAVVLVYTEQGDAAGSSSSSSSGSSSGSGSGSSSGSGSGPRAVLRDFLAANLDQIEAALVTVGRQPAGAP